MQKVNIKVVSGVPQDSCLSPELFIAYVNDIDDQVKYSNNNILKYTDDIKIYKFFFMVFSSFFKQEVQSNLNSLASWSQDWELKLNVNKCFVLHFGKSNLRTPYTLFNKPLTVKKMKNI